MSLRPWTVCFVLFARTASAAQFATPLTREDVLWPVLNDHRAVLGGLFRRLWGLSNAQLEKVFPSVVPRDLQLI
jgi:hypothetical protein